MKSYRYLHLDVFTGTRFEGNQLAVFPEPGALTAAQMQTIAQEMNFSESTFVLPAETTGDVRMRIFTPGAELPMAGHPTIGTTFALAEEGVIARGRTDFVFELGVGPTPVSLEWKDGTLEFAWMTQGLPAFGAEVADRAALASAIGLTATDLVKGIPAQPVSCGVLFFFVALTSRAAVDRVAIDRRAYGGVLKSAGLEELPLFVFTTERAGDPDVTVYSRMLAPGFGIVEDPATGGASGPLGCFALRHGLVDARAASSMISLQGVAMRRPSRIHISIDSQGGVISRVRVGGRSVLAGRGELLV